MARLTRSLAWALAALPSVAVLAADLRMPSSSSSSSSSLLLRPAPRHLQASTRGAPDNTQPVGTNPVKIASAQRLGYQVANNSCSHRDLGFAGRLGAHWYAVYGDTLWCAQGVKDPESDQDSFHGMARDAVSLLTDDPLVVMDLHLNQDQPVPHQSQFVPFRADWNETNTHGFGGTSLCEVDSETGTGVLFYLINALAAGDNTDELTGAGVAKVELVDGMPTVTERLGARGWWWNATTTPRYGDKAAYRDEHSDYIYAWGGPPTVAQGSAGDAAYVYMARVRAADAFKLNKYEYWWGQQQGWKGEVLTQFGPETAVLWGSGQGQVLWNAYYGKYMMVTVGMFDQSVYLRTADSPQGPWTAPTKVYTTKALKGGMVYAGVAYPHLDTTGRTLVVSYTNNNHQEVVKVVFET